MMTESYDYNDDFYEDDFTDDEEERGSSKLLEVSHNKSVKPRKSVKAFTSKASVNSYRSG